MMTKRDGRGPRRFLPRRLGGGRTAKDEPPAAKKCSTVGCDFFAKDQFQGMCSGCFAETAQGSDWKKEQQTALAKRINPNNNFTGSINQSPMAQEVNDEIYRLLQDRRQRRLGQAQSASVAPQQSVQVILGQYHEQQQSSNETDTVDKSLRYIEAQSIWEALEENADGIKLLRASWLKKQSRFPNRSQRLPKTAYITIKELQAIHATVPEKGPTDRPLRPLPIIAISHCWQTAEDPDPDATTFRKVVNALEEYWPIFNIKDLGIFFDWSSLYQKPRTSEQQQSFRHALESMNLWYAHYLTTVWVVSDSAGDSGGTTGFNYWQRGWTQFEFELASLVKSSNMSSESVWPQLLDLGRPREPVVRPIMYHGRATLCPQSVFYRPPPAEPMAFREGHMFGEQVFTNEEDRNEVVAPLFQKTMVEVMGGIQTMNYNGLGWGDDELDALMVVLPLCHNLEYLQLAGNRISDEAFLRLGRECLFKTRKNGGLPKLQQIWIYGNPIQKKVKGTLEFLSRGGVCVFADDE